MADVELDNDVWNALRFVRAYYAKHGIAPDVRHLISHIASSTGCDKKTAKISVFTMFPYGYVQQACKVAGMKKPRAWSTG